VTKFILDCDPGHDDALAILYAAAHLDLIGVTTTFGNQTVDKTTHNALSVCTLGGLDIPVARGAAGPLKTPLEATPFNGSDVHGVTGMDGAQMPVPTATALAQPASEFLIEQSRVHAGDLVIIATGPLTNVAAALAADPGLNDRLTGLSIMGGSTDRGNVTAVAELNIYADAEAAALVMQSPLPKRMVGLNVTTTVGADSSDIARLNDAGRPVTRAAAGLLDFYLKRQQSLYGRQIAPFHDLCAVVPFVRPELIDYRRAHVAIELAGEHTRGMTVCDFRAIDATDLAHIKPSQHANVDVAIAADGRGIVEAVLETLIGYDRKAD
jgi:inosine-uridine nucleoside N-ribohydrolase